MKRLFYLMPILFIGQLYADQTTSGVGLILPTTGAVDRNRSYGDKLNSNFSMIGSSLTTADTRLDNLDTSTGTFADASDVADSTANLTTMMSQVSLSTQAFTLYSATAPSIGLANTFRSSATFM